MSPLSPGAKPAVLRCSRCGRFVDWEDARLQIVCSCRAYVKLPAVIVRAREDKDQSAIIELFERDFGYTKIVSFGEDVVVAGAPALVAWMKGELAGVLVSTTNDNLPALYFYQRREYHIQEVVPGGMLAHVTGSGTSGFAGIPLRDEIRLERLL